MDLFKAQIQTHSCSLIYKCILLFSKSKNVIQMLMFPGGGRTLETIDDFSSSKTVRLRFEFDWNILTEHSQDSWDHLKCWPDHTGKVKGSWEEHTSFPKVRSTDGRGDISKSQRCQFHRWTKLRWSQAGFTLWEQWIQIQTFMKFHPIV